MSLLSLFIFLFPQQIRSADAPCSISIAAIASKKAAQSGRIEQVWDAYLRSKSQQNRNILWGHYFVELYEKMRPRLSLKKLHPSLTEEDLKSEFALALLKCIENFDPSSQTKFETFCSTPLAFTISNLKRYHKPLGNRAAARRTKVHEDAMFNLKSQGKTPPTQEELKQEVMLLLASKYSFDSAEALETETRIIVEQGPNPSVQSLSDPATENDIRSFAEPGYVSLAEDEVELEDFLNELLADLSVRDQIIVRLLLEGYTQAEIPEELKKRGMDLIISGSSIKMTGSLEGKGTTSTEEARLKKAKTGLKSAKPGYTPKVSLDQRDWLLLSLRQLDTLANGNSSRAHDLAEYFLDPGPAVNLDEFLDSLKPQITDRNYLVVRLALKGFSEEEILEELKEQGFRKPRLPLKDILRQELIPDLEIRLDSFKPEKELQRLGFDISESRVSQIMTRDIAPKLEERLKKMDSTLFEKMKKLPPR